MRDFKRGAGVLAALVLWLLFSGEVLALDAGGMTPGAAAAERDAWYDLPLVMRDDPMRSQRLCRFGVGAPWEIARYPVNQLRIGWYTDWGAALQPIRPGGIEYLQMVRLSQIGPDAYSSSPQGNALLTIIAANPGAHWVIGNEPDRRKWQDDLEPAVYAHAYHDLYDQIKAADPTARIVAGSIVQPTPLRLKYLDMVLDSYRARYGQPMPVDVWNIHAFILNERSCTYFPEDCWGADVPPGIDVPEGNRYGIQDNDSLVIFKQFIVDFRRWMADRGYQGTAADHHRIRRADARGLWFSADPSECLHECHVRLPVHGHRAHRVFGGQGSDWFRPGPGTAWRIGVSTAGSTTRRRAPAASLGTTSPPIRRGSRLQSIFSPFASGPSQSRSRRPACR